MTDKILEVRGLTKTYGGDKKKGAKQPTPTLDVLKGIDIDIYRGDVVCLIGPSGCGKSSLLNLIPRFYDVTGGRVTIDGIDVREMPQEQLHSLLGYVPQKGVLFSGTIESNLKFGGAQITDAGMKKAASIAQATEFIDAKPDGTKPNHIIIYAQLKMAKTVLPDVAL